MTMNVYGAYNKCVKITKRFPMVSQSPRIKLHFFRSNSEVWFCKRVIPTRTEKKAP